MKKIFKLSVLILMLAVMTVSMCACSDSGSKTCPSCGKKVSYLKTAKDWADATHTWCTDCWDDYWDIMGR